MTDIDTLRHVIGMAAPELTMGEYQEALASLRRIQTAIGEAMYCLNPNQGERPDPSLALQWLRTTLPKDHPNYLSLDQIK